MLFSLFTIHWAAFQKFPNNNTPFKNSLKKNTPFINYSNNHPFLKALPPLITINIKHSLYSLAVDMPLTPWYKSGGTVGAVRVSNFTWSHFSLCEPRLCRSKKGGKAMSDIFFPNTHIITACQQTTIKHSLFSSIPNTKQQHPSKSEWHNIHWISQMPCFFCGQLAYRDWGTPWKGLSFFLWRTWQNN